MKIGFYFLEHCLACISCDVNDEAIQLLFLKSTTAESFSEEDRSSKNMDIGFKKGCGKLEADLHVRN